jgi:uncharacterized protein
LRILIDIGHPGHVHLFRPFAQQMIKNGHAILFTCREKEFEIDLLKAAGFQYKSFGKKYKNIIGKLWGLIKFDILEVITALQFKPDMFLSHGSPYAAHAAWFIGKPHISMEDSGNWEQMKLYLPFTKAVLTPDVLAEDLGKNQIRYKGYHELAYLHPNYFKPEKTGQSVLGLKLNENYVILRFVSWNATHDKGQNGLTLIQKMELVNYLKVKFKVFISSEGNLPSEFEQYKIKISPEKMHQVLSDATFCISEGATMASESGVLGTPAVYVNSLIRMYNEDQEQYDLVFNFKNGTGVLEKVKQLATNTQLKEAAAAGRKKLLEDKIDVTAFMVWFVENYPESYTIMKREPDYQLRFK